MPHPLKPADVVFDTETTSLDPTKANILGYGLKIKNDNAYYYPEKDNPGALGAVICHNGKYDSLVAYYNWGLEVPVVYDTMIAEYLLHIDQPKKLETIVKRRFKKRKKDLFDLWKDINPEKWLNKNTGKPKKNPPANLPDKWWEDVHKTLKSGEVKLVHRGVKPETLAEYGKDDVIYTAKIKEAQLKEFEKRPHLKKWFEEVEMPFCNMLIESEKRGVKLDIEKADKLRNKIQAQRDKLEARLLHLADNPDLNLNSPIQMQPILYDKFGWPKKREWKTKTGYKTAKEVYETMAPVHAFAKKMLQFNELDDLLIKFLNPLPEKVDKEGRIHCTYNQCGTRTRRMSSQDPNLQQIPAKTELGQEVRACFVPAEGHKFLIADYDQIEIRLAAHYSEDPRLIDAIMNAEYDVHTCTAADMYGVHPKDVTKAMRAIGKLINFSIFYGKSAYGFAKDWRCSEAEAQEQIDLWFKKRPRVKEWIHEQKAYAKKTKGWVETVGGLPLFVGDVYHPDHWVQAKALRRAVNYPIQGSSQDIIKKGCVKNYFDLELVPLLLVHDEAVWEIHSSWFEHDDCNVKQIVKNMEDAWKLKVPLKVSWKIADYWEK